MSETLRTKLFADVGHGIIGDPENGKPPTTTQSSGNQP